jgi:hypothetical protein
MRIAGTGIDYSPSDACPTQIQRKVWVAVIIIPMAQNDADKREIDQ